MSKKERKSFILYQNFENQFNLLSLEERGELITAIFEYTGARELSVELSPLVKMAFSVIKDTLDRDHAEYLERCEINSQNGKKGGRPKKYSDSGAASFAPKTERFFEKAKKADNDNGNENDNDNDNGNGNGKEKDNDNTEKGGSPCLSVPVVPTKEKEVKKLFSLSETDKKRLLSKGVSEAYISERAARAEEYAENVDGSAYAILLEWWRLDKNRIAYKERRERSQAAANEHREKSDKSYDTDEFFEGALRRAQLEFGMIDPNSA